MILQEYVPHTKCLCLCHGNRSTLDVVSEHFQLELVSPYNHRGELALLNAIRDFGQALAS